MTKGKYAARAALRREDASVQSEIAAYRHNVQRLMAENRQLQADLDAERQARKKEARALKAQLAEGLSPELLAVREELEHQRQKADRAVVAHREMSRKWHAAFNRMFDLLDGLQRSGEPRSKKLDALDTLIQFCAPPGEEEDAPGSLAGVGIMYEPARQRLGPERVQQIAKARGHGTGNLQLVQKRGPHG